MEKILKYLWSKITLFILVLTFLGASIFFYIKWIHSRTYSTDPNIDYQRKIEFLDDQILNLEEQVDSLESIPKTNEKEIITKYKDRYNYIILNDDSISQFFRTELSKKDSFR